MRWWPAKLNKGHEKAVMALLRGYPPNQKKRLIVQARREALGTWHMRVLFSGGVLVPTICAALIFISTTLPGDRALHRLLKPIIAREFPFLCPICGYDLRASPERCPECGTKGVAASDNGQRTTDK